MQIDGQNVGPLGWEELPGKWGWGKWGKAELKRGSTANLHVSCVMWKGLDNLLWALQK